MEAWQNESSPRTRSWPWQFRLSKTGRASHVKQNRGYKQLVKEYEELRARMVKALL